MHRNLIGNKYGKLTVIADLGHYKENQNHHWSMVRCECGNEFPAINSMLVTGKKYQCTECARKRHITHNMTHSRLYRIYAGIKNRCYTSSNSAYKNYGGRGIKMCQEWLDNPSSFFEWAYKSGYKEDAKYGECTIDRIDVNGDYCPENCRWVDDIVQSNNRRNTYYVEYKGKQTPLKMVAKEVGIKYNTLYNRLMNGYSLDDAITLEVNGEEMRSKMGGHEQKRRVKMTNNNTGDEIFFDSCTDASLFLGFGRNYLGTRYYRSKLTSFEVKGYHIELGDIHY